MRFLASRRKSERWMGIAPCSACSRVRGIRCVFRSYGRGRSLPLDESFDIGADTLTGVAGDYQVPFDFTGTIDGLTITLDPPKLTPEQEAGLKAKLDASLMKAND